MDPAPQSRARVAVIGAGLAGLGAAFRLARRGFEVVVLERRAWAGGRAAGEVEEGFSVERALPVMSHADRHLVRLIGDLGAAGSLLPLRLLEVAQVEGGQVVPVDPFSRAGVARIPGVRALDALRLLRLPRLLRRYASRLEPDRPERAARWDDRSIGDFARLYFGRTSYERWLEPAAMACHLSDAEETSRVAFLIGWVASESGRAHPGVPRAPLQELVRAACDALDVRFETEAQRIEPRSSGYVVYAQRAGRPDRTWEADAVVVATAAGEAERIAAPLVTPAERDYFRDVSYAPAITLTVGLARPLSSLPRWIRVPRVERSLLQGHLCEPGHGSGRAPDGSGIVTACATERFGLAHAGAADEVVEKGLLSELERFHPRIGGLVRFTALRRAHGAVPHFQVGAYRQLERFRNVQGDLRTRGRRLYFAGDHLCGPRPEQALSSGVRAAAELVADLS